MRIRRSRVADGECLQRRELLGLGFVEVLDLEIDDDEVRIEDGGMAVVGTRRLRMI